MIKNGAYYESPKTKNNYIIYFSKSYHPFMFSLGSQNKKSDSFAQLFIDVHDLGRRITLHSSFNEFLGHIPDFKWESRVYLAVLMNYQLVKIMETLINGIWL